MDTRSKALPTHLPIVIPRSSTGFSVRVKSLQVLFCFVFVLIVQIFTVFSQSWYVLTIDINKCLNCGRMIVTMGTLIEQAMDEFDSKTETKDTSLYEVNRVNFGYDLLSHDTDLDIYNETDNAEDDDNNTLFKIENQIDMYVGLWKASLCTQEGRYCALVDTDTNEVFSSMPLLSKIKEKIIMARLFFLVTMVIAVLTIISEIFGVLVSRSNAFMSTFISSLCSAFVSLTGVATASLPFFNVKDLTDVITVHTPWSLILMLMTDYVFLAAAFRIWRTWRILYQNTSKLGFQVVQDRLGFRIKYYSRNNMIQC